MEAWQGLKNVFHFIRQEPAILYSLFLIVLLPFAIWGNTLLIVSSFEKNSNFNIQQEALSVGHVVSVMVRGKIDSPTVLQTEIEQIASEDSELDSLKIIQYQNDKFQILASPHQAEIGQEVTDPSLSLAWHQNQNIAYLAGSTQERFWTLVEPVMNQQGEKIALVSLSLSLKQADALVARTARDAYIIAALAILLALLLVFQHTRLFSYLNLYRKLQTVDKMKDEFIRMSAHELLTPIVNIRGYIELLNDELQKTLSNDQKEYLSRVSISAKNLSDLISDILEVARIERKAVDTTPENLSPRKIIKEILPSFALKAKEKNLSLVYQEQTFPGLMRVNSHRLYEILNNLLSNAVKYTTVGGTVEVKEWIDEKKQQYCISVQDTGMGITGEEQKNLFHKFYRIKSKETLAISGTGLGLWIVKNLCQRMKGSIVLESMKGVGSKFTIAFPLVKNSQS